MSKDEKYIPSPATDLRVTCIFDLRPIPEPIAVLVNFP